MGLHAPTWERVCARGDGHAARGVWGVCHRISRKSATNISSRELTRLDVVFRKAKQARLLKEGEEESALLIMTPDVQQAKQRTRQQEHGKLPPPQYYGYSQQVRTCGGHRLLAVFHRLAETSHEEEESDLRGRVLLQRPFDRDEILERLRARHTSESSSRDDRARGRSSSCVVGNRWQHAVAMPFPCLPFLPLGGFCGRLSSRVLLAAAAKHLQRSPWTSLGRQCADGPNAGSSSPTRRLRSSQSEPRPAQSGSRGAET